MTLFKTPALVGILLFACMAGGATADVLYVSPSSYSQGDVVEVIAVTAPETSLGDVCIISASEKCISRNVFFLLDETFSKRIWVALLAVSPTQSQGILTIIAYSAGPNGEEVLRGQIRVISKEFATETINLDGEMSDLRQTRDERRIRESQELWEILIHADAHSVYQLNRYQEPLEHAVVTSFYGERRRFVYKDGGTDNSVHSGIDLAIARGTPVTSAGAGRVAFADERKLTGNTVVLEHLPGVYSMYYHLDELHTREGETVGPGEVIGVVGDTGLVTGVHLHWEIRVGGVPADPASLLNLTILDKGRILKQITAE